MTSMASIQTSEEIESLLTHFEGEEISTLQVLGINSLKSMTVMPETLAGDVIRSTNVDDRHFTLVTDDHEVVFDLQRTGKLVPLHGAVPYVMAPGAARPTVRLVLTNGQGLDLTEPAKTKRITVTISTRS